jgi:hypothetical protein
MFEFSDASENTLCDLVIPNDSSQSCALSKSINFGDLINIYVLGTSAGTLLRPANVTMIEQH